MRRLPPRAAGLAAAMALSAAEPAAGEPPFGPGERLRRRITWARLLAGRATLAVERSERAGRPVLEFVLQARSEGFFAWLTRFRVNDRTVAAWDPLGRCSLGIEKRLREGRHARDQRVRLEPQTRVAEVEDARLPQRWYRVGPCAQDMLSAFFVARANGWGPEGVLAPVRTFDNGRIFDLRFRFVRPDRLDLPPPLGRGVPTRVFEVLLLPETGVFEQQGRLFLWVTDDGRRIPARVRAKAPVGWVSADLEGYDPPSLEVAGK